MCWFRRDNPYPRIKHATAPAQLRTRHHSSSNSTQGRGSEITITAGQILNYDVLSVIFVLSCTKSETSPVKLASVCRQWREVALATPQIWTKISLYTSKNPKYIEMYVNRSSNLPLDITICDNARSLRLKDLAPSRIGSLAVADNYRYLLGHFPLLERLELVTNSHDRDVESLFDISFSLVDRFPKLRELCILHISDQVSIWATKSQFSGFPPLQKLEMGCHGYWETIVNKQSNTLISLHLSNLSFGWSDSVELTLPQLRHLRITEDAQSKRGTLKIDAPRLESLEERRGWDKPAYINLELRHQESIKHFYACSSPLRSISYTSVVTLWVQFCPTLNVQFRRHLALALQSCRQVTRIRYRDDDFTHQMEGASFGDPQSVIQQIAGGNIIVGPFDLSEMNLPGSLL